MVVRKRADINGPAMVFVTTTLHNWQPLFAANRLAAIAADQLDKSCQQFEVDIVGWVIMPSHVHALLGFREIKNLSAMMHNFKSFTTRRIRAINRPTTTESRGRQRSGAAPSGRIWKPRFDDLIVWSERQFRIKLDYIHNNPVKDGLVGEASAYRWSSASAWQGESDGLIRIEKYWSWTKG